jgi:hypothetical protein
MQRKRLATAEQLRFEIQRRIRESEAADRRCRDCQAPTPRRADMHDATANWTVDPIADADPMQRAFVDGIVQAMRLDYQMIEK